MLLTSSITSIIFPNNAYGLDIPVGISPFQVAVDTTNNKVYVVNQGSNTVSVIDGTPGSPTENTVIDTIAIGLGPVAITVNPNNQRVYTTNQGSNTVSVIDGTPGSPTENTVIATLGLADGIGSGPVGIKVDLDSDKVYVGNIFSGTLSVIDGTVGSPTENTVTNTILLAAGASRLAIDSDLKKIYVVNFFSTITFVVDIQPGSPTENTLIGTITVGNAPAEALVDSNTNKVYVTNRGSNSVSVIDGTTNTVINTIPVGNAPNGIDFDFNTNLLYVSNNNSHTVSVIDTLTDSVIATIPVGLNPGGLAIDITTDKIYVANRGSGTITVLEIGGNLPPIANAGPNQKTDEGNPVMLDGTASLDPDGIPLSYNWLQTSGPPVILSDNTNPTPTFLAPQVDSRTLISFSLVVNDGTFDSVPDNVDIIINDITTFQVPLNPIGDNLEGSALVGDLTSGKTISFDFITTPGILLNGELQQTTVTTAIDGTGNSFDFLVNSDVSQGLPPLPVSPALFFDIEFQGEIDFSNPSNLPADNLPKSKFLINKDFDSGETFSDGCPVVKLFLLNENTNVWEQIGNPTVPNTNKIFIANTFSNTISIIDGSTNTVETIPVDAGPFSLHYDKNTNKLYTVNSLANTVSVIDTFSNTVVATIPVGSSATSIDVNTNNNRVYVGNRGSHTVSVIDGTPGSPTENTVIDTIPVGLGPSATRVNPITNQIYVANFFGGTVSVIDGTPGSPTENTVIDTIPVGAFPGGIAIDTRDNKIYLAIFGSNVVSVIDGTPGSPTEHTIIDEIQVGTSPSGPALNVATNTLYVASSVDSTISVVDITINANVDTIPTGGGTFAVSVNPNSYRLYTANSNANTLSIVDIFPGSPTENTVIDTIPVGIAPFDVDVIQEIPNPVRDPSTDVIDMVTGETLQCAYIGDKPHLSKFAIGGIKALALGALGGSSSGGGNNAPSISPSSFAIISGEDEGFGGIINDAKTFEETKTFKVGEKVTLRFDLAEGGGIGNIEHVGLYTNIKGGQNKYASDTYIYYDPLKLSKVTVQDPNGFFSDASFELLQKDATNFVLKYDLTFAKPMAKSDLILESWNLQKWSTINKIPNAIEVVSSGLVQQTESKPIVDTFVEDVTNEQVIPVWIKSNAKWWSDDTIDNENFISGIEYLVNEGIIKVTLPDSSDNTSGSEVQPWIKNTAGWWADDMIRDDEFLAAIEWLISNGIIHVG
jgi:YVTN family beta-propeller protein